MGSAKIRHRRRRRARKAARNFAAMRGAARRLVRQFELMGLVASPHKLRDIIRVNITTFGPDGVNQGTVTKTVGIV